MAGRRRRRDEDEYEPDDDEDVRATESLRVGYAQRAKQRDVGLALRAACQIFVSASNPLIKDLCAESDEHFCLFASSFIGKIWMHSVRELIDKEQSVRGSMSVLLLRKFKLRVCNYLRKLLPGAMNQKVPAPLLTFCEFLKDEFR